MTVNSKRDLVNLRTTHYNLNMQNDHIIEGTTCFKEHKNRKLPCCKETCRRWMNNPDNLNCAIIASEIGEHTLQEIGDIFGVTRMRICQMEKNIMKDLYFQRQMKATQ